MTKVNSHPAKSNRFREANNALAKSVQEFSKQYNPEKIVSLRSYKALGKSGL
jgi:hypothetical protein